MEVQVVTGLPELLFCTTIQGAVILGKSLPACPSWNEEVKLSQYFLKSGSAWVAVWRWGLGLPQVTWTFNHWALGSSGPSDHLVKPRSVASRQKISNRDSLTATTLCAFPVSGFSSSHVRMWELDQKEGWAPKNWCFWILVLKKTLESSLDCKEKSVLKEINPEYSLERLMNLQYFGHLMWRAGSWERPWCWERLKAKWVEGGRRWDG